MGESGPSCDVAPTLGVGGMLGAGSPSQTYPPLTGSSSKEICLLNLDCVEHDSALRLLPFGEGWLFSVV